MSKVYMNEAAVTVEEADNDWVRVEHPRGEVYWTDPEARAVVEGLLRRMLERETRTYEISALEAAIAVVREGQ